MGFLFGDDNKKNIKKLTKIAQQIDDKKQQYKAMSDSELKGMTAKLKERLSNGETLDDILVDAFAVTREAGARVLNMEHFFVQLMGGIVLHQGRIAEMRTGEGKTLVATLPAYLNALSGNGVHIVTVNEYLAKRDAEWMGKIYNFLGVSVGVITNDMSWNEKQETYNKDIIYGTNSEFGFDYLRDNMVVEKKQLMRTKPLNYAIIDEVDSILIDEARTPLIISGEGDKSSDLYEKVSRFMRTLKKDDDYNHDEEKKSINLTENGAIKAERFFGIENLGDSDNSDLNHHIQQALKANFTMHNNVHYIVEDDEVLIVDEFTGRIMNGRRFSDGLHQAIEAKEGVKVKSENKTLATITIQNFFRLYRRLSGMTGTAKTEETEFNVTFGLDVVVIPTNLPMIRIDENDKIYGTAKGKLNAVVERIAEEHKTGRPLLVGTISVEKSEELSTLLLRKGVKHTVLNAKNHAHEAEIVAQAGKKGAVTIATNMAGRGTDILLGGNPEHMAKAKLRQKGIEHDVIEKITSYHMDFTPEELELKKEYEENYQKYKEITDAEKAEVLAVGGLLVIGTERHESRRIDNQLRGRTGRQGDAGQSVFFISMDDELCRLFIPEGRRNMIARMTKDDTTPISLKILTGLIESAQRKIESTHFSSRKRLLEYDNVMNKQREIIYIEREKILNGENIHSNVLEMIKFVVKELVQEHFEKSVTLEDGNKEKLNRDIKTKLFNKDEDFVTDEMLANWDVNMFEKALTEKTIEIYEAKVERYKQLELDFAQVERVILLRNLDRLWIEHIDTMEQFKRSVTLRAYAQQDPILYYKTEGYDMFMGMQEDIQRNTGSELLRVEVQQMPTVSSEIKNTKTNESTVNTPKNAKDKVGRNDTCPCGSGRKYKNCCGK